MRPKVVIVVLLAAAGILATILLTVKGSRRAAAQPSADSAVAAVETNLLSVTPAPISVPPPAMTPPAISSDVAVVGVPAEPQTNHEAYVQERVASLLALAMNDDDTSLNAIWSELSNPDPEIRQGALKAVIQFGDRSVAPRLRDLAGQINNPAEKADFLAAADRLEMPALGEVSQAQPKP